MADLRSGDCRYTGRILRPSVSPTSGGREGQPEVLVSEWIFSNRDDKRHGREVSIARQMTPLVTHVLKGWKPAAEVKPTDYVEWDGRRLNIDFADPYQQNGMVLMLVCIEKQGE